MTNIERALIGALGGLAAILVRYLSQDHAVVMQAIDAGISAGKTYSMVYDYSIVTPITVMLGAIIGWIVEEANRLKVFAMAVSAPALITTWAGASTNKRMTALDDLLQPSSAIAQTVPTNPGLATFANDREHTYVVHVGSFEKKENADQLVLQINTQAKTLRAFTSEFKDNAGRLFHRVLVIRLATLPEALALREVLLRSKAVTYAQPLEIGR